MVFTTMDSMMDDIAELKHDIDRKLEKEENNLALLRQCLTRYDTNTTSMIGILNSFEERLENLEKTIIPVYNETENLRRRQENIEKTMHTLDTVLSYYHTAKDVEQTIKEGPAASDLETYMSYLEKVLKAKKYFELYSPKSKEIKDIERIYDDGKDALQLEFRSLLHRHGRPVPPVVILDLLNSDEDLPPIGTDTDLALEQLSEKVVEDLRVISKWLTENGRIDFMKAYTQARSTMLSRSLAGLKEHLKSSSGTLNTSQLSFGNQNSPAGGGKFRPQKDVPTRKSMNKIAKMTKKVLQLEQGHRRQGSFPDPVKEDSSDLETDLYISEMSALLRLMQSEAHLMKGIIPEKHQRTVFDNIIQASLETLVTEGELLATAARKNVSRHDFGAVLSIFPIVQHLRLVKPEFDLLLEGCQAPTRAKLTSLLSTLDSTGAKALEEFTESTRDDKSLNMPKDGIVHQLANQTMMFLEQLQGYCETAGAMLLMHGEKTAPSSTITPDTCRLKAADYMTRVLSALGLNLSNKAQTYNDLALRPIFMLNNLNYILKSMKRSGLLDLLSSWNKEIEFFYNNQILEQKSDYSESWSKVLHYILEMDKPMSQHRTQDQVKVPLLHKLKDKERQNIKDKFTGFNKELEEIYRVQKTYAMPDSELKSALIAENKDYMIPRYTMFYNKYSHLNFTKNRNKYIKYQPSDVAALLDKFFSSSE
ncbi:exocyst complex component 7-like isoform X1 [Biomphalaria glabrata]|uniref:Exocyst complex component 7 n=1 Tax=Biomphalaria glabrata TaxID=6526 RepID=A0A9W2ZNV9_BIOGL|nr:exocyst complex component 7-like isoform X1 [Biomphalaria glabrata]XP_055876654.1 exocyst complex component 7-like isoform X1 [Biomphalaria glabrata]XP_055876655.1 exocyst complex component 7-like isoform X1 [Biomphalaria glabrata]XP_055876656.1 exocyst complex component 7-like isoform X1 [Biomphalaria glabrata]XP_055876657.1 exocyst complex component 7-like isoform X1 [Biomphalaria glabrata]KAI8765343.1 exocyst complex component 7-like [Biomphalaria glabrata]